jgi:DNA (cytosine-5)-methyltransferase 1
MTAYYNEIDRFCCDWLSNLMDANLITPGKIDDRSIVDVRPNDLAGFERVHFFAGIGGWDHSLNVAGWSGRAWTGSCPCQPFSLAGAQRGFSDDRHLWPEFRRLIAECSPPVVFGEQVASAAEWLRLVRGDLEALGYAVGALPIQAASAAAAHLRDRYWFVADGTSKQVGPAGQPWKYGYVANAVSERGRGRNDQREDAEHAHPPGEAFVTSGDGKRRPIKPGIRLLAHGIPNRLGILRGFGNAIDPRPAAAFIGAFMTHSLSSQHQSTKGEEL